jgi:hypothetical protein
VEIEDDTAEQPHSRDTCYGGSSSISTTRRTSPELGPHAGRPEPGQLHDHRQKKGDLERSRPPRGAETLQVPTPLMPASSFGRKLVPLVLTQSRASRYNDDERKDGQRGEKDTSQRKFLVRILCPLISSFAVSSKVVQGQPTAQQSCSSEIVQALTLVAHLQRTSQV